MESRVSRTASLVERARPEEKAILARTVSTSAPAPLVCPSVRGVLLAPDLATRRGFAVSAAEALSGAAGAAFSPGRATGAEGTVLARKLFVTETDLNADGFFTMEFVRTWSASRFDWSTLPGRLMSVSEPPLASATACESAAEWSLELPLLRGCDAPECLLSTCCY